MSTPLSAAAPWFRTEQITDSITRIDEPHVHELLRANIWHVRGRDRDLVVDAGLGVASLREHLPEIFANNPILVVTHAHLDHAGSAHEFSDRRYHPAEEFHLPVQGSLHGPELTSILGLDWPGLPSLLLDALPSADYVTGDYSIPPATPTSYLEDGDEIDLGDRTFRALHLPGHTPGSLCLFEDETGILFTGDVLYDDVLLDEIIGSNIPDYATSMKRLRTLPVQEVLPGHGPTFGRNKMLELIDIYLQQRSARLSTSENNR